MKFTNDKLKCESQRLIVRTINRSDFRDIVEYGSDADTGKYMVYWPKSEEQIRVFIEHAVDELRSGKPNRYEFVLEVKEQNKVIGNVTVMNEDGISEIGWISNKLYWNRGYMTEGLVAILRILKSECGISKIYATCTEENVGSYRVMEKIGMRLKEREENAESTKQGTKVRYTKLRYEMNLA